MDVTDPSQPQEGDIEEIFQIAKEEFGNSRLTLEVSFNGKGAVDAGRPGRGILVVMFLTNKDELLWPWAKGTPVFMLLQAL